MKRFFWSLLVLLICILSCPALRSDAVAQLRKGQIYTVAEQQPEFPGGSVALSRYLADNIRVPGMLIRKKYNAGPVSARFVVDELGYVHDVRILAQPPDKEIRRGMEAFMANIIAAVEKMPRWTPGRVGNKPVPVFYTLPVEVSIQ